MDEDNYWSQDHISGFGLVAWRVEAGYIEDPTVVLRPMENAWYPETYINAHWYDGVWTWESRDCLRAVMKQSAFRIDVLIYALTIRQEGPYQEALTGVTPSYPANVLQMDNSHWRNDGGPYWIGRRASDNGRQRASDNGRRRAPDIERQVIEVEEDEVRDEEYGEEGEEENGEEEIFYETEDNVIELTPIQRRHNSRQIPELSRYDRLSPNSPDINSKTISFAI